MEEVSKKLEKVSVSETQGWYKSFDPIFYFNGVLLVKYSYS